jgi:hypothetical protein
MAVGADHRTVQAGVQGVPRGNEAQLGRLKIVFCHAEAFVQEG